ncbi:MAG: hypothetical protein M1826_002947 [Phylliscum demangeonii]|nr:MAG: hypothetical protein M1826_002947 [Phylliscum demangeonii]
MNPRRFLSERAPFQIVRSFEPLSSRLRLGPTRPPGPLPRPHSSSAPGSAPARTWRQLLPRIAQPAFWQSLLPRAMRERMSAGGKKKRATDWNPATFYIVAALLIGSHYIRALALRHDFAEHTRKAALRIELLREVIERVMKGEEVDVERLLGTGDETREKDWARFLKEMEEYDAVSIATSQTWGKELKAEKVAEAEKATQKKDDGAPAGQSKTQSMRTPARKAAAASGSEGGSSSTATEEEDDDDGSSPGGTPIKGYTV